jgi:hypothetical protein
MATTNPTTRLKAGVLLLGLRVSVAVLVKGTTMALHLRLRCPLIVVHIALTLHRSAGGDG